ncbi:hypothetical protein JX265_010969 [Neoarthrinium moseri]|uniref:EDC4-like protein pdc1 beta-propeller domain-containing protein n=1 Tax=Neoarthrinium moseri TaxID=1658444 RepID=A0A9Q0AHY2_9PEZI|nr:hypothetical protein JX266_003197 [Neoarthrinium moseri]KAI1857939.1 hypothetical protein JX265_010969 [Neoarthrinium moseri]
MASYNPSGANDPNNHNHLQSMLARLQAGRSAGNPSDERDLLSRFATLNQANQSHGGYYGSSSAGGGGGHQPEDTDSPLMSGSDVFPPPAAPTPPMSHFSHSHGPPGLMGMTMGLGPIGSMPPSAGSAGAPGDQSANLLNLLKFKDNGGGSTHSSTHSHRNSHSSAPGLPSFDGSTNLPQPAGATTIHAPVPMPADPQGFLASLMKGDHHQESQRQEGHPAPAPAGSWNAAPGPAEDTQTYLLNLLQRKKPSQTDQQSANESAHPTTLTPQSTTQGSAHDQSRDLHGARDTPEKALEGSTSTHFPFLGQQHHAPSPPTKPEYSSPASQNGVGRKTIFDYKDPFDDLSQAPSPHNRTPKSMTSGSHAHGATAPTFQILKKAPSATSSPGAHEHRFEQKHISSRRSPAFSPENHSPAAFEANRAHYDSSADFTKEPVSKAVGDIAQTVNEEAQEALARAEGEEAQARIARELEDMLAAKSEAEFDEKSEIVARDIQHELQKEENSGILEDSLPPEMAKAIHDIVDEAAHSQPVADSWESAEADEIVVIEEEASPVKVYNFPMKPWISISLQENEEPRPQFRDEVILDIARVKKEFDQIDRNLVSATETYIIYGMSKAGGLRVIRQDDGRDAKLFTDTKDRIFNVAVSSTPADLNTPHKESIIGTGISGTVYYELIKNGEKDYLDDAHPEQHGFALPPITTQEGDAPGGVLKTRARTSSTHPEYFAVGRGKTISIVWPSFIMQNNLFKPGHDRVVDTETLSKKCSLRINTGKAGKDFTFSQDDTTIVSLDKSGRVKFWDVRDLTAADEGSDPRFPMPAQTSLEVKEPLMTLTTTPEGEKAWPTSVLLLDKQRPYQKRCALRYMIVGMKQNHTLQLWDLALGKPVQEFNLPHSKESDAVCSVMYHPPTGMIVVGHPTRNSIYFLHLSAPKYTLKGLSQVDFIQKLVAKDSSVPEPDSTAVISGVREYSFANKGVIRSLDMLTTPAASSDSDEQTLFELYAMHSKGVSGICIKQNELGWTKDNKVVAPVDALATGVVKIGKLKELPAIQPIESQTAEDSVSLPIRTGRSGAKDKENTQPTSGEDVARKGTEDVPSTSNQHDRKSETNATPSQLEKAERRSRKKKDKAAAAAAEKNAAAGENGTAQAVQVTPASGKNTEAKASSTTSQSVTSSDSFQSAVKQVETTVANAVEQALRENRQKMDQEARSREGAFKKSQQNLLDVVSATLDNNVQQLLTKTISSQFEQRVIPALDEILKQTVSDQINRIVTDQLDNKLTGRISHAVQNQMQKLLPNTVGQALLKPEVTRAVTSKLTDGLASEVQKTFVEALNDSVTPAFSRMAVAAATKMVDDVHKQAAAQIEDLEQKLHADSNKIDQLSSLVNTLSETVATMAKSQAEFQTHFRRMYDGSSQDRRPESQQAAKHIPFSQTGAAPQSHNQSFGSQASSRHQAYSSPSAHSGNQVMTYPSSGSGVAKDQDLERKIGEIAAQVNGDEIEGALVRWLQSDRKDEIFAHLWSRLNTAPLQTLSPLVGLAVIAELAQNLDGPHLNERIDWVGVIIGSLYKSLPNIDSQVREVIPNILGGFINNMEALYARVAREVPTGSTILGRMSSSIGMARRIVDTARNPHMRDY